MQRREISEESAKAIWQILVETCGARKCEEEAFVSNRDFFTEWRFQGHLGFGGKVWNKGPGLEHYRVSYYIEDGTRWRDEMATEANRRLMEVP